MVLACTICLSALWRLRWLRCPSGRNNLSLIYWTWSAHAVVNLLFQFTWAKKLLGFKLPLIWKSSSSLNSPRPALLFLETGLSGVNYPPNISSFDDGVGCSLCTSCIIRLINRKTRTPGVSLEHILARKGFLYKKQTFQRLIQPSAVITRNDPPSDYSWAKPRRNRPPLLWSLSTSSTTV